jgi:GntR family transcriptional regulator
VPLPSEARIGQRFEVSRAPLYVHDHVLADQEGHRQSHRLHLPIATVVAHPALEAEPFVTPEQLYEVLRDAGLEITCTDYVRARVPYPADIATLDLQDGGLVLITRRLVRSTDGHALALEETRLSSRTPR